LENASPGITGIQHTYCAKLTGRRQSCDAARFADPYFAGFTEEKGDGEGLGFNVNYPLPENIDAAFYMKTLNAALAKIRKFNPTYLVVCVGLDTAKGDPTGTWSLNRRDFELIGQAIGRTAVCTLVVQEGGYRTRSLGRNCSAFLLGIREGMSQQNGKKHHGVAI
jgi:acetoin utilization deacetylase AcuC-like enzyme